jgi:hypothetical protein
MIDNRYTRCVSVLTEEDDPVQLTDNLVTDSKRSIRMGEVRNACKMTIKTFLGIGYKA